MLGLYSHSEPTTRFFPCQARHLRSFHALPTPDFSTHICSSQFDPTSHRSLISTPIPTSQACSPPFDSTKDSDMKVDPHADESTADVDPVTYSQYMEAAANAMSWEKEADRLRALLDAQMGNAYAGLVDGRKLLTHRPTSTFRVAQLVKDYPELTQHYLHSEVKQVVDMAAFVHDHPEIAESYRSRQFRSLADL